MKYHCLEKTIDVTYNYCKVRLWIDQTRGQIIDVDKISDLIYRTIKKAQLEQDLDHKQSVLDWIRDSLAENIEDINAVQVIDPANEKMMVGSVAYTVAFEGNDLHG